MLKYIAVATAARAASMNRLTKLAYRRLGNGLLTRQRLREGLPDRYVDRARFVIEQAHKSGILRTGGRVLELGTGWVHWEAVCLRLFFDVEATLFDVWDNRLFRVFSLYMSQLVERLPSALGLPGLDMARAQNLLQAICSATCFEQVYDLLGFTYIVEPSGSLADLPDATFDLVVSCDVLEHVGRNMLPRYVEDMARLLKPGGHSVHQIDIADHLAYFDPSAPAKQYLRYSDEQWDRWFESDVQYINRIQRGDWLAYFASAGLALVREARTDGDVIGREQVNAQYAHMSADDLECTAVRLVHRRA